MNMEILSKKKYSSTYERGINILNIKNNKNGRILKKRKIYGMLKYVDSAVFKILCRILYKYE
jgi:hypothetical protein